MRHLAILQQLQASAVDGPEESRFVLCPTWPSLREYHSKLAGNACENLSLLALHTFLASCSYVGCLT